MKLTKIRFLLIFHSVLWILWTSPSSLHFLYNLSVPRQRKCVWIQNLLWIGKDAILFCVSALYMDFVIRIACKRITPLLQCSWKSPLNLSAVLKKLQFLMEYDFYRSKTLILICTELVSPFGTCWFWLHFCMQHKKLRTHWFNREIFQMMMGMK